MALLAALLGILGILATLLAGATAWVAFEFLRTRRALQVQRTMTDQLAHRGAQQIRDLGIVVMQRDQYEKNLTARTQELLAANRELAQWRELGQKFVVVDGRPYSLN